MPCYPCRPFFGLGRRPGTRSPSAAARSSSELFQPGEHRVPRSFVDGLGRKPEVLLLDMEDAVVVVHRPPDVVHPFRGVACRQRDVPDRIQAMAVRREVGRPRYGQDGLSERPDHADVVLGRVPCMLPDPSGAHLGSLEADGVVLRGEAPVEQLVLLGVRLLLGRDLAEQGPHDPFPLLELAVCQPALVAKRVLQGHGGPSQEYQACHILLPGEQRGYHGPLRMAAHDDSFRIDERQGLGVPHDRSGVLHEVAEACAVEVASGTVGAPLVVAYDCEPVLDENVREAFVYVRAESFRVAVAVQLSGAHDDHYSRLTRILVRIRHCGPQGHGRANHCLLLACCHLSVSSDTGADTIETLLTFPPSWRPTYLSRRPEYSPRNSS